VLRKILGPEGEKVMAEWKKLHNEELHPHLLMPG
jgi:hypothetical protein